MTKVALLLKGVAFYALSLLSVIVMAGADSLATSELLMWFGGLCIGWMITLKVTSKEELNKITNIFGGDIK